MKKFKSVVLAPTKAVINSELSRVLVIHTYNNEILPCRNIVNQNNRPEMSADKRTRKNIDEVQLVFHGHG